MSLITWITSKVSGIDLAAEQQRGNELDAKLGAMNQEALATGRYDQAEFDQAEADRATGAVGNVNAAVTDEFWVGWGEGETNIKNWLKKALEKIPNTILPAIPWQLYVLAAVALFLWMGGAGMLRGILNKK